MPGLYINAGRTSSRSHVKLILSAEVELKISNTGGLP